MAKMTSGIYSSVHNTSGKANKKNFTRKSKRSTANVKTMKPRPIPGFHR